MMPSFDIEGAAGQQVRREARPLWLDPPEVVQQQAADKAQLQQVRLPALECHGRLEAPCRNPLRHCRVSPALASFPPLV